MFDEKYNVLLIDDDPDILTAYQDLLEQEGYRVLAIANPQTIVQQIPTDWKGVVLCDVMLPRISGLTVLDEIMQSDALIPVIMITGHGDVPMAVNAVKKGATDFLEKPVSPENLLQQVENSLNKRRQYIDQRQWQREKLNQQFIGHSDWINTHRLQLQALADSHLPVFLWGENGTGRFLSAVNLHHLSQRNPHSLVFYECTEHSQHPIINLIEQSKNSTLIIKHLHWLSGTEQNQLTAALHSEANNIRFIAISDFPLVTLIQQYHLSAELYSLFIHTQIELLPLHKHPADIVDIFLHYVHKSCIQLHKSVLEPPKKLLQHLCHQQWIGNVTELISVAELYAIGLLSKPHATTPPTVKLKTDDMNPLNEQIGRYEKQVIEDALIFFQGRINEVANYLDIPRKKLYLRMRKYGIDKREYKF
ncbi:sigma-54-dependent Fis family transcriptional regulator [Actinobacillus succinogenes]|uniref:Two component transcriptional regulator, Fis family n=1 Tax=Actinobacillus succinogenes (strain ATCC 55618 / DSM 22257 / CCUG 43843 / 130Z) TaxID=339671 RepID=A6VQ26_ACTSZ|nr:sigma-54 dependent transcriptional regulator [Actinobacillus succinogenes]ABR75073.1 two component transcriptional regulator, Fis family [Actinobacillus succinogenes 130Z]PHI40522.1 sigma-54-dependent Fis family transcriptional regulator [Actinobacillus succinogenes]